MRADLDDDTDHDSGITDKEWLEAAIQIHLMDTGLIPHGLALRYARDYGVEAEKRLIAAITERTR